jgi:DNA-3-methyladenine glycosylase II
MLQEPNPEPTPQNPRPSLTLPAFRRAVTLLTRRDPDLARAVLEAPDPPFWQRQPGFPTLILLILEQQVSIASALATYNRLVTMVGDLTPGALLELDDEQMRSVGFSRQKTRYARALASAILVGRLDLPALDALSDEEARAVLVESPGIGPWTADTYLLSALRRPDVWPVGDRALQVAAENVKRLPTVPSPIELLALAEPWRPFRAVAARILWHHYLTIRRRMGPVP